MLRALVLLLFATSTSAVLAQGACCGPTVAAQPTIAYSPVVAAPAPTVYQTTTVSNGWYPGKYLGEFTRNLFGANDTTVVTAAPYTAGYAPYTAGYVPYTAGYSPYVANYSASPYVASYAPTVAYRPTYPATYGPVTQTVSRPVVLSPVVSSPVMATSGCDACSACGGVEQAYYSDGGCSSCAAGSSYSSPAVVDEYRYDRQPEYGRQPTIAPDADVSPERSTLKPEADDQELFEEEGTRADSSSTGDYFAPPPRFAPPSNNVAGRTHPAPVRTAVYREQAGASRTSFRPATAEAPARRPAPKVTRLSSDGWRSATD